MCPINRFGGCLALLLLLVPCLSFAAPTVSSVSGTLSHGNSITISGSNFGTKSPAKPLIWAPFEDSSVEEDASLSTMGLFTNAADGMALSSADLPHSRSTKAARGITNDGGVKHVLTVGVRNATVTDKIYIFARRKYAHATFLNQQMNFKFWRFWPTTQVQPDSFLQYRNYVETATGQTVYNTEVQPYSSSRLFLSDRRYNNVWFTEEVQASHSDIDVDNGTMRYWQNGTLYQSTSVRTRTATNGYTALWGQWYIQTHWTHATDTEYDQAPPSGAYVYYDDLYMDRVWSRVMIGNASTFDACTHREPLIPTAWSATSITAYFNQGSFANGSPVYLYVVDSTGAANATGKAITISGTYEDATDPYVDTFSPADGATGVAVGTTSASFHFLDAGDGADSTTLALNCTSPSITDKNCGEANFACSGTSADITATLSGLSLSYDQAFSCVITGSDLNGNAMSPYTWNWTVASDPGPGDPDITTTTVATGTVGTAASTVFAATDGTSPYTWSVLSGTLPPGKSLSSNGTYSGTPTTAGTYNWTVGIVDAISGIDNQALSQVINAATPGGQTTVIISTIEDTFINLGSDGDDNYSSETYVEKYTWPTQTVANRGLYDITLGLPDNITILSATLYSYKSSHEGSGADDPMNLYAYRISGTTPTIATVTWNSWAGDLEVYESFTPVYLTVGWYTWDVTAMVTWSHQNASHLFVAIDGKQEGAADTNRIFTSMEGTEAYRPYLSVTYMQLVSEGGPSISAPGKFRISSGRGTFR